MMTELVQNSLYILDLVYIFHEKSTIAHLMIWKYI